MANMSYCRFENTLRDLDDCKDALEEGSKLSGSEFSKAVQLVDLCLDIATFIAEEAGVDLEDLNTEHIRKLLQERQEQEDTDA